MQSISTPDTSKYEHIIDCASVREKSHIFFSHIYPQHHAYSQYSAHMDTHVHICTHTCACNHTHTNYVKLNAFVNNTFSSDLVIPACQITLTGRHLTSNELEEC